MITRKLSITGIVQGVGYRDALRRKALALGVGGWVRNCRGGSVEALVQGEEAAVAALVEWARRGPPSARVEDVQERPAAPEDNVEPAVFEVRPSI